MTIKTLRVLNITRRCGLIRKYVAMVLLFALLSPVFGLATEKYYIDQQPVLLYKIINWWNNCLPDDCDLFCGKTIFYTDQGNVNIEKDTPGSDLKLRMNGEFAEMLVPFRQSEAFFGPNRLQCKWLNEKYFGDGTAEDLKDTASDQSEFRFKSVSEVHVQLLKKVEKDIGVVLKGVIGGLIDSKIALHRAGKMPNDCLESNANNQEQFPISLMIVNAQTKEVLAEYTALWE